MRTSSGCAKKLCNHVHIRLQPTSSQPASLTSIDGVSTFCACMATSTISELCRENVAKRCSPGDRAIGRMGRQWRRWVFKGCTHQLHVRRPAIAEWFTYKYRRLAFILQIKVLRFGFGRFGLSKLCLHTCTPSARTLQGRSLCTPGGAQCFKL